MRSFDLSKVALLIITLLIALTYEGLFNSEFISYDDSAYIVDNPCIKDGLTMDGINWAFSSVKESNWHPLTWISHMLDVSLFGLDAGGHHAVNLIIHTVNTMLLSFVLSRLTGDFWKSLMVAALFGLHPLHVESVAWVSERKDVLSGLFFMLILLSYDLYVKRPSFARYSIVLIFFLLGLMSKPMLVTVPFVLLLLDFWPLRRWDIISFSPGHGKLVTFPIREKIPLFLLAAISSIVTLIAQKSGGAVVDYEESSLITNIFNAAVSYVKYIYLTFVPTGLSVFYPFPRHIPVWKFVLSTTVLVAVSFVSFRKRKEFPFLAVGWFWFLGMMVPVIGIIRVGAQAMADRYTYLPSIGLFIFFVWGLSAILDRYSVKMQMRAGFSAVILAILCLITHRQVGYWHDTISLFTHAAEVSDDNSVALENLGSAYARRGEFDKAIDYLQDAVRVSSSYWVAYNNLGNVLSQVGRYDEAMRAYSRAIELKPDYAMAHFNLGLLYMSAYGDMTKAMQEYRVLSGIDSGKAGFLLESIAQVEMARHGDIR